MPGLHLLRTTGRPSGPIPYDLVEPADGAVDLPLIIGLHGRGDRAERFAHVFEDLRLPIRAVIGRAPLPLGQRGGRQWFEFSAPDGPEQVVRRVQALQGLIQDLKARYPGAPRPILLGFSQGAMLALQMLARHPEDLGGVVALSGFLPVDKDNVTSDRPVPTLLTMGEHDHRVIPDRTRAAAAALRALGHQPEEVSFEGGHAIPREIMDRVRGFIRQVARIPAP